MIGCKPTRGCAARYTRTPDCYDRYRSDYYYNKQNTGVACNPPRDANAVTGACELPPKQLGCAAADAGFGNPCDASSGNKFQSETDFQSSGVSLSFVRHYNSGSTANHGFGTGWTSSLHRELEIARNTIIVRRGSGRGEPWRKTNTVGWVGDADTKLQLTEGPTGYTLTRPNNDTERYALSGKLISETTAAGLMTTYAYDASDRLTTVTGPFGHTLTFAYDASGRLDTLTDPAGKVYRYTYTTKGSSYVLSQVIYPDDTPGKDTDNPRRTYHYENPNYPDFLTGITDENGDRFATYAYDANGNATLTEYATTTNAVPQERFTLSYDSATQTTVTDAAGNAQVLIFAQNLGVKNLLSRTHRADGKGISQVFDARNNLISRTDAEGRVTTFTYNASNQRVSKTKSAGTAEERTTAFEYVSPDVDLVSKVIEPSVLAGSSKETSTAYDANFNVAAITINGFKLHGKRVSRTTTFSYNGSGQLVQIDGPRTNAADTTNLTYYNCTTGNECGQLHTVTNALGHQTTHDAYDANGRVTQVSDPLGIVTTYRYDPRGRVTEIAQTPPAGQGSARTTAYAYDGVGQVKTVTTPDGIVLTYSYDAAHDLKTITDNLGNQVSYLYDLKGNRRQEDTKDPDGTLVRTVQTAYDLRDRVSQINAAGSIRALVNNAVGNLTSETDPNANPAATHTYDPLHRLDKTIDAIGGTTTFAYDVQDNLKRVIAPNGAKATYGYDDLGNLRWDNIRDRGLVVYNYDTAGNATSVKDARTIQALYSYDALNRLTLIDYPGTTEDITYTYDTCLNGTGRVCAVQDESGVTDFEYDVWGNVTQQTHTELGATYVTQYIYDAGDRVTSITYPSGRQVTYLRDAIGRVSQINTTLGGKTTHLVTNRTYRADGLLTGQTFGNGLVEARSYDLQGRLQTQTLGSLVNWTYEYDANGNVTKRNQPTEGRDYAYDPLDRLVSDIAQLATAGIADYTYSYDGNSNRLTETEDGSSNAYTYDANQSNRLATIAGQPVVLDASGNTTSDQNGTRVLAYNQAGRLVTVHKNGALKATYTYNAQGQRTRKVKGANTFIYLYDLAGNLLGEYKNGKAIRDYVWVDTQPLAHVNLWQNRSGAVRETKRIYLLADHLNTPRVGVGTNQAIQWRWNSNGFGKGAPEVDPDNDGSNTWIHLRFPGQYHDGETGFRYNWHRYYDPRTGRYISSDPIGLRGGLNSYVYAENNPLYWIDPKGLDVWTEEGLSDSGGIDTVGNGNWVRGFTGQDWKCSGEFSGLNRSDCTRGCCIAHDQCFEAFRCNQSSWYGNLSGANGACQLCNLIAAQCIVENVGKYDCANSCIAKP